MLRKRKREEEVIECPANSEQDDVMRENDDEDENEGDGEEANDTNEDEYEGECQECGFLVIPSHPEDHEFCVPAELQSDEKVWDCPRCGYVGLTVPGALKHQVEHRDDEHCDSCTTCVCVCAVCSHSPMHGVQGTSQCK